MKLQIEIYQNADDKELYMGLPYGLEHLPYSDPCRYGFASGFASMCMHLQEPFKDVDDNNNNVYWKLPFMAWRHMFHHVERGIQVSWEMNNEDMAKNQQPQKPFPEYEYLIDGKTFNRIDDVPQFEDISFEIQPSLTFQPGTQIVAIDPCYDSVAKEGVVSDVKPGVWRITAMYRDDVNSMRNGYSPAILAITHDSVENIRTVSPSLQEKIGTAGVDSGTCGFFIKELHPTDKKQFEHEPGTFYRQCCDAVDTWDNSYDEKGKSIATGVVVWNDVVMGVNSRTYYGDGGYNVMRVKDLQGDVVALWLVFDTSMDVEEDDEE